MRTTAPLSWIAQPPTNRWFETVNEATSRGRTVTVAVFQESLVIEPEIVQARGLVNTAAFVEPVHETDVFPAGTRTEEGTRTPDLSLLRFTVIPFVGAGPVRVKVPVKVPPTTTLLGLIESPRRLVGRMVRVVG